MTKIKVTAVSYLNTKPLLYGILKSPIAQEIDLQLDIPSVCADKLQRGQADLGLVPVAVLPRLSSPQIVSDFCIGAEGAVKTVCIYGERPIEEMEAVYLDFHSRTSVALTKILLREHWRLTPRLIPAQRGYEQKIGGAAGGLIIGDRTIGMAHRFPFVYDLGQEWERFTGLPFVFAAWVSNRSLDPAFLASFNAAMAQGIAEIPQLMYLLPVPEDDFDLQTYFTQYISYDLNDEKRKALLLFLNMLKVPIPESLRASLLISSSVPDNFTLP
jgi:chorismate dehydratase